MSENIVICEKCGIDMQCYKNGHSLSWICNNCGNAVATSYFEPYETDMTTYYVYLMVEIQPTIKNIKLIAEVMNCNYIEAKKTIEKIPTEIFQGKAIDVMKIKKKFATANIEISIEPVFP